MHMLRSQGCDLDFEPFSPIFKKEFHYMRLEGQFDAALNLLDEFYDGFKHLSFHCDDEQNKKILSRYRTIFLYRENIEETAISLALARLTKVYKKTAAPSFYYAMKARLDPDMVLQIAKQAKQHQNYIEFAKNCYVVSYERLYCSAEKQEIKKRIFNFCELEIKNEAGIDYYLDTCHKLNKNLNEQVENYDQVMEYLSKNLHT